MENALYALVDRYLLVFGLFSIAGMLLGSAVGWLFPTNGKIVPLVLLLSGLAVLGVLQHCFVFRYPSAHISGVSMLAGIELRQAVVSFDRGLRAKGLSFPERSEPLVAHMGGDPDRVWTQRGVYAVKAVASIGLFIMFFSIVNITRFARSP